MKFLVINGPNLNLTQFTEPGMEGQIDFNTLLDYIEAGCAQMDVQVDFFQSNHEGDLIDEIQSAAGRADGIILNPGGLGSDAAIEAADVVLMTDEPSKIAAVMKIARKTIRIANQNIVFALGVKFLVLILGALGYANMWAAVFADVGVSIIAILNAIRAMRVKLPDMPAGSTNQG